MKQVIQRLNKAERTLLQHLTSPSTIESIHDKIGLPNIAILRAATYLQEEGLVSMDVSEETQYHMTDRGEEYLVEGLPELQVYDTLGEKGKSLSELRDIFSSEEVNASIGRLKRADAIMLTDEDAETVMKPKDDISNYPPQNCLESAPIPSSDADSVVDELVDRSILVPTTASETTIRITDEGRTVRDSLEDVVLVDDITPQMLEQGTWKDKTFRSYRVTEDIDPSRVGQAHFVREAIEDVKDFWVSLGFQEMRGDHVQSSFWDLDALFVPQNHPARDLQDTFYLDAESDLPDDYLDKIKDVHETGGSLQSDGWQDDYDTSISKKTLLRTHTTVLSAKKFAGLSEDDLPKKYFSVDKVYRNETLDWSHLMEFHQVEGIVVTKEGSLSRLISYLEEFFGAMGYDEIRVRPAYFPYTEPSAEVEAYNEEKDEWVEIGGAGIIRPEVTKPLLGFTCPVMAWGTGLERILTEFYDIHDLRQLYDNDIKRLQEKQYFTNAHYIN